MAGPREHITHLLQDFEGFSKPSTLDKRGGPRELNKAAKGHQQLIKTFSQMWSETAKEYRMEEHFGEREWMCSMAFY